MIHATNRRKESDLKTSDKDTDNRLRQTEENPHGTRGTEECYRALVEQASDGIFITDSQQKFLDVNNSACGMLGFSREEMLGMMVRDVLTDEEYAELHLSWNRLIAGDTLMNVWKMKCKDGTWIPLEISAKMLSDGRIQGIARNITERARHEAQLIHLATHDTLTGLPNRSFLQDRLQQAILKARRSGLRVAVFFCDLDRFKCINDLLGHDVGDELLQTVAGRLLESVRESDTVARLGGDEFAIILEDFHTEEAVIGVAQKILRAVDAPIMVAQQELSTSTSIGISLFPENGETVQSLLKNADAAMYLAKSRGKNNFQFYSRELTAKALVHSKMEIRLRQAIEREELILLYQPQMEMRTHRMEGVEALLRWHSPELGVVLPEEFIPLAEETGLIGPIGEWVLRTACAQITAWKNSGLYARRIAVNLSPRQFMQHNLVNTVERVLNDTGLEAHGLELEITESSVMQNAAEAMQTLNQLKALGVSLAMEDFGTGFSNLNYLQRFPIDTLKIDPSFVRGIETSQDNAMIIQAAIALARAMKLRIVAEGVESEYQMNFLTENRCDAIQGFFISHPLPAAELTEFLKSVQ